MDSQTLLAALDFSRARLLAELETIEKNAPDPAAVAAALAWRPGPGAAHIAWQAMHCAATHDRYLHVGLLQEKVADETLVASYAGGSTPSDQNIPTLAAIREKLTASYAPLRRFVEAQTEHTLARQLPMSGGKTRSVAESLILIAWHEAHHQGQIHLTWNLFKAGHGMA